MPGSSGQVWNLQVFFGRLMMGHHKGSFEVEGDKLLSAGGTTGTWKFVELEPGKTLIAGTYRGIELLKFKAGHWQQVHKLSGFNLSSRHLETLDAQTWLVSHEYKGVFELKADEGWSEIKSVRMLSGFGQGIYSSLAQFDGKVWYFGPAGLFNYDRTKNTFVRNNQADTILDSAKYFSGKMVPLVSNVLCFFRSGSLVTMRREVTDDTYRFDEFPVAIHLLKPMRGFENISAWGNRLLLGGVNQYFLLQQEAAAVRAGTPMVYGCTASSPTGSAIDISLKDGTVPSGFRTIVIRFGTPFHQAFQEMQYQYRLLGLTESWSPLHSNGEVTFNALPSGNYVFQVRSALSARQISAITEFPLLIERPLALNPGMIFLYFLGLLLLVYAIHRSYTGYYRRQRRKLVEENEKNIRLNQLTLEQDYAREKTQFLETQFGHKKKELAQTMIHLNKNVELLSEVRDYLSRLPGEDHRRLLQKIEGNLSDEDSWTLLETAFRQVDSEFLNKIRQLYPDLSPSDLKLCVYLRLNLSSKEISTLLNISAKSVEIKRYRLRKKMGLDAHVSLQSFVLGI